jgi:hypothetical protein
MDIWGKLPVLAGYPVWLVSVPISKNRIGTGSDLSNWNQVWFLKPKLDAGLESRPSPGTTTPIYENIYTIWGFSAGFRPSFMETWIFFQEPDQKQTQASIFWAIQTGTGTDEQIPTVMIEVLRFHNHGSQKPKDPVLIYN